MYMTPLRRPGYQSLSYRVFSVGGDSAVGARLYGGGGFEIMLGYWQPLDNDVFLPTSREKFCEGGGVI